MFFFSWEVQSGNFGIYVGLMIFGEGTSFVGWLMAWIIWINYRKARRCIDVLVIGSYSRSGLMILILRNFISYV